VTLLLEDIFSSHLITVRELVPLEDTSRDSGDPFSFGPDCEVTGHRVVVRDIRARPFARYIQREKGGIQLEPAG
jgi:hypothetical protein